MKTISVRTKPTPDSVETDITLIIDRIDFAFKPPMEPWLVAMPGATFQVAQLDPALLVDGGLVEFDTPEGTKGYANPKQALGWVSPQLGTYIIVFPNSRIGVKATAAEVEKKMTGKPVLEI